MAPNNVAPGCAVGEGAQAPEALCADFKCVHQLAHGCSHRGRPSPDTTRPCVAGSCCAERQEADRKRIEAQGVADFQTIVSQVGLLAGGVSWQGVLGLVLGEVCLLAFGRSTLPSIGSPRRDDLESHGREGTCVSCLALVMWL